MGRHGFVGYVTEESLTRRSTRTDARGGPCASRHQRPGNSQFWSRIRNSLQLVPTVMSTCCTTIGDVFMAIFLFATIALLSFFVPALMRLWKPELRSLQMSVDKIGNGLVLARGGIEEIECGTCKLCQEAKKTLQTSRISSKSNFRKFLDEHLSFKKHSKEVGPDSQSQPSVESNKENISPPPAATALRTENDRMTTVVEDTYNEEKKDKKGTPSKEFCKTSRQLYKKLFKKERHSESPTDEKSIIRGRT